MRRLPFLIAVALLLLQSVFVVPAFATEHEPEVTVEEGAGDSGNAEADTTTDATAADNSPPVAFAGEDQTVSVGSADAIAVVAVTLDGSLSSDPDGTDTIATYDPLLKSPRTAHPP